MDLQTIAHRYRDRLVAQFGDRLSTDQWSALNAIDTCRKGPYGELVLSCNQCRHQAEVMRSCGHRACNQCQYHSVLAWLERQRQKQLPVNYYLVTFTLPSEPRSLARANPKTVYSLLMQCAADTLKSFGLNKKGLNAELGLCAVLHTHTRRLDYHPHVHIVVPGGGIHRARREWRKLQAGYLFNGKALAAVFRGAFLQALEKAGLPPGQTPKYWVAHCKGVGRGEQALTYLARYLYRGVISNRHILEDDGTHVTFRYRNSETDQWETRRETGEVFLYLLMQHVLPKGFRRARDYGFLHGNAKALLIIVQWVLRVPRTEPIKKSKATFLCPCCGSGMMVSGIKPARTKPG
ncbi:MAG: transposase [Candidatus Thiodiazotropha sp. (ex Cardiolucina cf. quadrata)]|nr:transposase [Candidatus Thiodiazotropha sp. (ex Cardiolucina cf. quadrata)]